MATAHPTPTNPRFNNLTGLRFDRLVVESYAGHTPDRHARPLWNCACDCGGKIRCRGRHLVSGKTRSCGCLKRDSAVARLTKHGCAKSSGSTPEYLAWVSMKARCLNPRTCGYHRYGGRGIRVCDKWLDSFTAFLEDVGPRPSDAHSLDRIDSDGNYEPGNCRWATRKEQANNTSGCLMVSFEGRAMSVAAWADTLGLSRCAMENRLRHWPLEKALTAPKLTRRRR